jgi:hypothetical protein
MAFYVYRDGTEIKIAEADQDLASQLQKRELEFGRQPFDTWDEAVIERMRWVGRLRSDIKWRPCVQESGDRTWNCQIAEEVLMDSGLVLRKIVGQHGHVTREEASLCAESKIEVANTEI